MRSLEKISVQRHPVRAQQERIRELQFTSKPGPGALDAGEDRRVKDVSAKNAVGRESCLRLGTFCHPCNTQSASCTTSVGLRCDIQHSKPVRLGWIDSACGNDATWMFLVTIYQLAGAGNRGIN